MSAAPRLATWRDLKDEFGIPYSRQHVGRLEKQGKFPKRVKLNGFRCVWYREEIEDFIRSPRY
jgi:prophage regulatory protein